MCHSVMQSSSSDAQHRGTENDKRGEPESSLRGVNGNRRIKGRKVVGEAEPSRKACGVRMTDGEHRRQHTSSGKDNKNHYILSVDYVPGFV